MEQIVKKRSDLLNYFYNENKTYTKLDILNKEYAALSFSVYEEFIDAFVIEYEDMLTPIEKLEENLEEVFIKGIVIDIDNKKGYSIIHIQNKADNISIMIDGAVLYHYSKYLEKGHVLFIKGHTYNGKVYMHFLIDYSSEDSFLKEHNYLTGISNEMIDDIDYSIRLDRVALVKQAKYFKSQKGNNCLRLQVYEEGKDRTYITCNGIPKNIVAGMFISFIPSDNSAFCNNVRETQI